MKLIKTILEPSTPIKTLFKHYLKNRIPFKNILQPYGIVTTGYLKAVWPDFWGAFLRSGRPRGPRRAFQNVGGDAPHIFEGLPGPPGLARPQKRTQETRPDCLQVPDEGLPTGYLKAIWLDFWGAFLKSGRPRGPWKAFKNVGGDAPHLFEGLPGPPGLARPQKCTPTNPARLPSGTQVQLGNRHRGAPMPKNASN